MVNSEYKLSFITHRLIILTRKFFIEGFRLLQLKNEIIDLLRDNKLLNQIHHIRCQLTDLRCSSIFSPLNSKIYETSLHLMISYPYTMSLFGPLWASIRRGWKAWNIHAPVNCLSFQRELPRNRRLKTKNQFRITHNTFSVILNTFIDPEYLFWKG